MTGDEVVITGVGLVTPLGASAEASASAWAAGRQASTRTLPELAATPLAEARVATLPELDPAARLGGRRMLKYMSAAAVLGSLAAREAITQARTRERFAADTIGLYAATGLAAARVEDVLPMISASIDSDGCFSCRLLGERGLAATNPLLSFRILANIAPCLVSIMEQIKGPNLIFSPWEGQGAAALVEAWQAVGSGQVAAAVTGAADFPAHAPTLVYLRQAGLIAVHEVAAAAATYLVLERAETAHRDHQPVLARLTSCTLASSAQPPHDPLAARLGRSYAAAPATLLALTTLGDDGATEIGLVGTDRHTFTAHLEPA